MLMKLEIYGPIFEKFSNIKFGENPYSGSQVVPRGQRHVTKLKSFIVQLMHTNYKLLRLL